MNYIENFDEIPFKKILGLYHSVGWSAYTKNPDTLKLAIANSSYFVAILDDEKVAGIARSISDDVSIHYLQDVLVNPSHQGKGVGRALVKQCLRRFNHVRTHMVLTDDEEKQRLFYESLGYVNTKNLNEIKLNSFIQIKGFELK